MKDATCFQGEIIMRTTVYWFSATGNSLAAARQLAQELGETDLVPVTQALNKTLSPDDRVGFVFPVYAFGMPRIMHEFARKVPVKPDAYVFAVVTMGGAAGGPHAQLRGILRERGADLAAGWSVVMPGNYTPLYGAPPGEKQLRMFAKAKDKLSQIAADIRNGVRGRYEDSVQPFKWLGATMNRRAAEAFKKAGANFKVDQTCTHCEICARVCPVGNIVMKEGMPTWLDKCEQCMACLQWCPVEAIQSGSRTAGRRRYHHPDFKAQDFFQR